MAAALGDKVETKFIETVPEGAEAERVIRQFAADGYGLVFTTSFGYMNPTIKVAKRFPGTKFEHATGYKRGKNVGTYNVRFYEGRYLAGVVAGGMSEVQHRRLCGGISDPRSAHGYQRLHPGDAERQSRGANQSHLDEFLV